MGLTVQEELRRTFELATLRREAESIRTPRQWQLLTRLQERCDAARARENALFVARYENRVASARLRLIDGAGSKQSDLKPLWAGIDRFSPAATLRDARREVRAVHQRRLERIDNFEGRQMAALVRQARQQDELRDHAREAFHRAVDRRTGPERRRERQRPH